MMRVGDKWRWLLVAAYVVMWIGGVVTRSWFPSTPQPAWTSPTFLILAGTIATLDVGELTPAIIFAAGGLVAEWIGVHTGMPFGRYSYTSKLGLSIAGVPLVIAFAWLALLFFVRDIAGRITRNRWTAVVIGAALMTVVDLLVDPVATRFMGFWTWEEQGPFFGVPVINFAGWFAVSAILLALAPQPRSPSPWPLSAGFSLIAFFAAIAVFAS